MQEEEIRVEEPEEILGDEPEGFPGEEIEGAPVEEKAIGFALNIFWYIFLLKYFVIPTAVLAVILHFLDKPVWIAFAVGAGAYVFYRFVLRLVWRFIVWAGKQ